ncbi:RED family protein [Cardiosporidium cionae]|uniref:RED family protein n=1 Tax=Cardiosporidium cionae TaxID=476202 RepID=A0ABQ7JB62_9APIC|nr:RED family protein [Cardiosporidium cionae]|eukprot:KAF8821243.1 RED family protein [Cardiosporidium cionae]
MNRPCHLGIGHVRFSLPASLCGPLGNERNKNKLAFIPCSALSKLSPYGKTYLNSTFFVEVCKYPAVFPDFLISNMALTNADFRSLLNATDQSVLTSIQPDKKRKKVLEGIDKDTKKEKRKLRYIQLQKKRHGQELNEVHEEQMSKYKDRADDRRKCKDDFYQQVAEELREMKERSIEESKYLGGDIEHTHLVKGLDFALLSKVRGELVQTRKEVETRNNKDNHESGLKKGLKIRDTVARGVYKHLFMNLHPHHLSFQEKLKRIETTLLKGTKFKGNTEAFLPGRTCYVFDASMEMAGEDIPTVLFNSKDDCPSPNEGYTFQTHGKLLNELIFVLRWHAQNRKKKRHEREPRRPGSSSFAANPTIGAVTQGASSNYGKVDDEDIYDDVGIFNPAEIVEEDVPKKSPESLGSDGIDARCMDSPKSLEKINFLSADASMKSKMDIIRDEQGMEVDEDDTILSLSMHRQPLHTIPAGIDPTSSMAAVYGMGIYEDGEVFPYQQELENNVLSSISEMAVSSFVQPEHSKPLKSGMTTKDQDKGLHSVYKRDEEALKKRGDEDEREKDPAYISDTYMECYPGFGADVSFEMYGSDDEEDRSKMDMGRLKQFGAKRRDDFARREDWEQYQSNKEALPKAAFQYGRKMDDNRVTRRKKKLNPEEEWRKIEKMLGDNNRSNENGK